MIYETDSTTEQVQSTGGIALAAKISEKIGLDFSDPVSKQQLLNLEIIRVTYGLLVQGRSRFEEIKLFRHDPFFRDAFGASFIL